MKRFNIFLLAVTFCLVASTSGLAASYTDYLVYEQWGGTWQDVNKTAANTDDDLMCWAATASNILAWGHWGTSVHNSTTSIFQHILEHWTDNAGYMNWAWKWWFDGSLPPYNTYAYVDVPGGGAFYPSVNFYDYYRAAGGSNALATIDSLMQQGYGVGLVIRKGTAAHAVTSWGFSYELVNGAKNYLSIYLTDSDDGLTALLNLPLVRQNNAWYLGGSYAGWLISTVEALKFSSFSSDLDFQPVPVSPTWLLLGTGLLLLGVRRRRRGQPS